MFAPPRYFEMKERNQQREDAMMDIRVTHIYHFVDVLCEVARPDAPAEIRERLAEAVAEDLNKAGVYVEPS